MLLILPLISAFSPSDNVKIYRTNKYIITDIVPRSAVIKINGKYIKCGALFEENDTIDIPSYAAIRVKNLSTQKHSDIKGGKPLKLTIKMFNIYKQLNTKGTKNLEAIRNYLNKGNWLMISDTAFIDFPIELSSNEYFIFKAIPSLIEFKPTFNHDNHEITITKPDLTQIGIYTDNDSIIQFQVEVHNSLESVFVTDSLRIEYIHSK